MNEKITNENLEAFLYDHLERSEIVLLEQGGKESDDIMAVAEAKGYILKDSSDLAGFKTIYTFDTAANINKARLPKDLLLKALPGIIGKPVDIDHNRIYVVGHYIDYRYIAAKHMVIAYGVFYKSNFGEEWEKAKELFKAGKLGTSYEIWCPKSKRKYLADGTYILTNIEIAGGGLMFKEKPAFPDAKVLELAKKNMDEHVNEPLKEMIFACQTKKTYTNEDIISSAAWNYDALVGSPVKTATPAGDKLYIADSGKGFEKPVIGLPNPTHTTVGIKPTGTPTNVPGNLVDLQQKNALANTGVQPARLKNDNLADNVAVPGPQITASAKCSNCSKEFVLSSQTFQRKNSIDFYECSKTNDMHQCPQCKSIIDRQGFMLHPPQVIDFGMSCPNCRSSNWRLLKNEPEKADVKCMGCMKNYNLDFAKEESSPLISRFKFLREGMSTCPQCQKSIPYSTVSDVETKNITCPRCNLHYGINLQKSGTSRKIERANEYVQQEDYMAIAPTGGNGPENAPQSASIELKKVTRQGQTIWEAQKSTSPKQKFVPRSNQQIVDQMAGQNVKVDNQLTKNLKTDPNMPQNIGGALYIVRHGHTKYNGGEASTPNEKIRGWKNVPLDKDGKQEARELAQIFKGHSPDELYSSDLNRARETAAQISKATSVPIQTKYDLRPWNLGEYQGKPSQEVHPEIMKSAKETPHIKVKGGESFNNFKARALNMARKLLKEAKEGKKVVAVTHTRVAKLIQAWIAAGCPDDNSIDHNEFQKDTVKTGSIHKIQPTDKGIRVTEIADLQNASILDNTTVSSDKGGSEMSEQKPEVKIETPAAEVKVETPVVETPMVETPKVEAVAPVVVEAQPVAAQVEAEVEVEDAEAVESEEALEVSKTLKAEDRNKLSDDSFAVVKTVKDKKTGGTRTVRKYPIHDKAHVQNALSRLNQKPSRDGLRKLGVSPDAVINKVKAAGKKFGMETADMDTCCMYDSAMHKAEMEGYAVASKGRDMQKAVPRGKDNVQLPPEKLPNNYVGAKVEEKPEVAKKVKSGSDAVEGLTPDQVNQMQNQLFANTQKAMKYRKYHKATMKNLKALKKAMADGVFCSVQEPEDDVVKNMDINGKKTTTVSNDNESPAKNTVTEGSAPAPEAKPTVTDNNQDAEAKKLAAALIPEDKNTTKAVEPIMAPATPVENAEVIGKEATTVTNPDGVKDAGGIKSADGSNTTIEATPKADTKSNTDDKSATATNLDANKEAIALADQLIPKAPGEAEKPGTSLEPIAKTVPETPIANAEITGKGAETTVKEDTTVVAGLKGDGSATELLMAKKEIEDLKAKNDLLVASAVKLIERRNSLGEYGKTLSDKDILDDDKFEVAKIKAENSALKKELNSSSAHVAETVPVRSEDETNRLAKEIRLKAQKLL